MFISFNSANRLTWR